MSPSDLTPFEKGIDFADHFLGRQFTLYDIAERYELSLRQAITLKNKAEFMFDYEPAGYCMARAKRSGPAPNLWRMVKR